MLLSSYLYENYYRSIGGVMWVFNKKGAQIANNYYYIPDFYLYIPIILIVLYNHVQATQWQWKRNGRFSSSNRVAEWKQYELSFCQLCPPIMHVILYSTIEKFFWIFQSFYVSRTESSGSQGKPVKNDFNSNNNPYDG